jgi:hypothetical protein
MNIKKIITEVITEVVEKDDYKNAYINRINNEYGGLLTKAVNYDEFEFILGVDMKYILYGQPNKCEQNSYSFVKEKLSEGQNNYFPVGGYLFAPKSLHPVEHWWVYDENMNQHIDVSPMDEKKPWAYAGIINTEINNQILNSKIVWDIDFFKGGSVYFKYFK